MLHLIVDGANVAGSRPDGWWRDRPAAAWRLADQLAVGLDEELPALALLGGQAGSEVTVYLVLEGTARHAAALPIHPHLVVVRAPADGDGAIVGLAEKLTGETVAVVTADRELRRRVQAAGATTVGPRALLGVLPG